MGNECSLVNSFRGIFVPLLGERLRAERERLGLSQQELADKCGVTMRSQRNYEKGERQPDAAYLSAFTAIGGDILFVLTGQQPNRASTQDLAEVTNPVAEGPPLNRREQVLLANYRGSDEEGRRAVESTASALAHRDSAKKDRKGGQ